MSACSFWPWGSMRIKSCLSHNYLWTRTQFLTIWNLARSRVWFASFWILLLLKIAERRWIVSYELRRPQLIIVSFTRATWIVRQFQMMNLRHQAPQVIMYPRRVYPNTVTCAGECCTKCLLIFFTITCFLVGFIVTMVGHLAKPFWGPEDDWCDFCREERLATERNLKNCRIVGPIFLGIGALLLCVSIFYCHFKKKDSPGQVIARASNIQSGQTSQAGTTSAHYPPNTFGYQQSYGQTPAYPPGPYPGNPPPPAAGSYNPYPTGQAYPPTQQPYATSGGEGYQPYPTEPYPTELPPPPSYESAVDQSSSSPSAPPMEKVD